MKSKNLIMILIGLFIVLSAAYLLASLEKTRKGIVSAAGGIKGFIIMGPICSIQREGDGNCNDKPVKADIIIKDKKKGVVKQTETSEDGSFSIRLSPGNYVIYNDAIGNGLGKAKTEYVKVSEGNFAEVTIKIDTGIR